MRAKFYYLQSTAHRMIKLAIQNGDIIRPQNCEICGKPDDLIEAHHHDYSLPLDVIWLCRSCHLKAHGKRLVVHTKRFDAANIVRKHLLDNPQDLDMSAYRLAEFLNVGKSTVNNVQRELKGQNGHSANGHTNGNSGH